MTDDTWRADLAKMAELLGLPEIRPGQDIHKLTAVKMFGVPYDEVTPEQRKVAKAANYFKTYAPQRLKP